MGSPWEPESLPVRFMGTNAVFSGATGRRMQQLDRAFMQSADASSGAFMLFAIQDAPETNDRDEKDSYLCQVVIRWPFRAAFLERNGPTDVPEDMTERLPLMKKISENWASPYRDIIREIPLDSIIRSINLQDWVPSRGTWDNLNSRAALVGDAAHPMTMCKCECARIFVSRQLRSEEQIAEKLRIMA